MDIVEKMPISYHVALKAKLKGKWRLIDVTWDSRLKSFPINDKWDGFSDMQMAVVPEEIIEKETDPRNFEKEKLKKYTEEELQAKKDFYKLFDKILESSRGNNQAN